MPYIGTDEVAAIRKGIKKALPGYTFSIRKHRSSTVDVKIMSGPIVAVEHVNVYWYKDHLKDRPDAVKVIETILAEIKKVKEPKIVSEDGDYGSIPNFYYDVAFGAWVKPYACTDPDATEKLEIRRVFDEIKASEERTCGTTTLAPDDLILPCILPAGHSGYCDTGR